MPRESASAAYHDKYAQFREALLFTEAHRGFTARLIEKDYLCSLVLQDALPLFDRGLTFKGGTSLSKVHTDFYRLSEDLDFVIHVDPNTSRDGRRQLIEPVKQHIATLPDRLPIIQLPAPLQAHNQSTQYIGQLFYRSCITSQQESIKIEIGLREPVLQTVEPGTANTMLIDPFRAEAVLGPIQVRTLSLLETYAEKIRAALSRREPAIRDFFDLDHAIRSNALAIDDPSLAKLTVSKLLVSGRDSIDISQERLKSLRQQLAAQLRPVLREHDFELFDLDKTFDLICQLRARLGLK